MQPLEWPKRNPAGILAIAFPGAEAVLTDNQDGTVTASLSEDTQFPLEDLFPCPAGIRLSEREAWGRL